MTVGQTGTRHLSVRWFCEANFDSRVACDLGRTGGGECRELPKLPRREGNNFHVLAEEYHGIDRHGDWPSAEAQETPEIDHDHDLTIAIANKTTNAAEHVLTLDGTKDVPANEIAGTDRLRKPHCGRLRQTHTRRRRHTSWRVALRMDGTHNR